MSFPRLPSGPVLVGRRWPQKREGAPGKVRQLKVSADRRDTWRVGAPGSKGKDSVTREGAVR